MKKNHLLLVLCLLLMQTGFSQTNYSVSFNGISGYGQASMPAVSSSAMTMELWFSPNASPASNYFITDLHSNNFPNRRRVLPGVTGSHEIDVYCAPENTIGDPAAVVLNSGVTVSINTWYHVAVVINGTAISLYVDGVLKANTTMTSAYALTGNELLFFAKDYWSGASTYGNIKLDEVRIWSTARTGAEINANKLTELTGNEAGLVAYYKMSNGAGMFVADNKSGGTATSVLSGGPVWIGNSILPITLLSFTGINQTYGALLQWSTANESDNNLFELQRSSNGIDFITIGTIAGKGNTVSNQYYTYKDLQPLKGQSYYRLKQIDKNEKFTYSSIISLVHKNNLMMLDVYPNPATNGACNLYLPAAGIVSVYNNSGIKVLSAALQSGTHLLNLSKLSKGIYFISDSKQTKMVLLQ